MYQTSTSLSENSLKYPKTLFAELPDGGHSGNHGSNRDNDSSTGIDLLDEVDTEEPNLYKVLLLNDDYTPMDFVVYVLKTFFKHDDRSAEKIMLDVHKLGSGVAGVFNFEVAETKALQVNQFAKSNKYPLKCIVEEDK
ncbi:ATP-dependent Clp protease adapter ClpS [Bdellovibrio sp. qaytius]|nr:ATP-dependent Clp protease adapter ClpS [Bdellovibrio sp. qaytius]